MHVLRKASLKGNSTPLAEHPVPAARWARLDLSAAGSSASMYRAALAAVDAREQEAGESTDELKRLVRSLLKLCSHFFQVVDLAIDRGDLPRAVREYHHRDKNVAKLPSLRTYDDALRWAGHIVAGEARRAADEGAAHIAVTLPSVAQVQAALGALQAAFPAHTSRKSALTLAQQAVEALLPGPGGIDKLILDLYNDVDNHYRDFPAAARRDLCREWGMLFEGDAAEPEGT